VHVLDDLSTAGRERSSPGGSSGLQLDDCSVADDSVIAELVAEADVIVHSRQRWRAPDRRQPVRAIETNVHCTEVVLSHADRERKPVLLASTSESTARAMRCRSGRRRPADGRHGQSSVAYACSKAIDEFLAMAYWRERDLPITVVRLFNTVGHDRPDATAWSFPGSSARHSRASR